MVNALVSLLIYKYIPHNQGETKQAFINTFIDQ